MTSIIRSLRDHNGPVDRSILDGKIVAVYLSAHWCPPCRGFTPFLANAYAGLKAAGKPFELVFVSSDRSEDQFNEYYAEQPWLAVPWGDDLQRARAEFSSAFSVKGIPTLLIFDEQGELITDKGRQAIANDPQGLQFPWHPPSFRDVVGTGPLLAGGGRSVQPDAALDGKYVGVYFSAHWCPPCRAFTPTLVNAYNALRERGNDNFEVVFVSSDKSVAEFNGYHSDMPWLAVPFDDEARKGALAAMFDVEGLPTFVIMGPDGNIHNKNGRAYVAADPRANDFPWTPRLVNDLAQVSDGINDAPSVMLLMEDEDDTDQAEMTAALDAVARAHREANPSSKLLFFTSVGNNPIAPQIRRLTGMRGMDTKLILLDIADRGTFYEAEADDLTGDVMGQFVQGYVARTLPRKQLRGGR